MANLGNPILATLAYYDIFDYPLTLTEIYKYLINPARVRVLSGGVAQVTLSDINGELDFLVRTGRVHVVNGYYMLSGDRTHLYDLRIEREKLSALKWKKLLRAARWFQAVPYLRAMFVSGSMAVNNSTGRSDFDVLTVVRARRLYTCRFLLSAAASFLGVRRTRDETVAPDKFCFNHYVTADNLGIEHRSLFTGQAYAVLVPILEKNDIVERFYAGNEWVNQYVFHFRPQAQYIHKAVPAGTFLNKLARAGEWLLDGAVGEFIEETVRRYQQKRIRENPVTYETGGRVVFTDSELEFHPHSFETALIARYNERVKKMGIQLPQPETDSGLKT